MPWVPRGTEDPREEWTYERSFCMTSWNVAPLCLPWYTRNILVRAEARSSSVPMHERTLIQMHRAIVHHTRVHLFLFRLIGARVLSSQQVLG